MKMYGKLSVKMRKQEKSLQIKKKYFGLNRLMHFEGTKIISHRES